MVNWSVIRTFKLLILLLFLLCSSLILTGQGIHPYFKHLTVENGLSNNWVKCILKDRDGFMWFGTFNGINRYDGSQFKIFQSNDNTKLGDNIIECLAEDQ